jgi:molybdate transport system substrate-binding protein
LHPQSGSCWKADGEVMRMRGVLRPLLLLAVVMFGSSVPAGGADAPPSKQPLTVFAAASLSEAFKEIGRAFESAHRGRSVAFSFGGSSTLAMQIAEKAPADIFASADQSNMQKVVDAGETSAKPRIFATNQLTIAVPRGNPRHIESLADLSRAGVTVSLAAPEVPAGKYAAQIFANAAVPVPKASQEVDVRAVLSRVAAGEADAGIVYVSDIRAAAGKVEAVTIPAQYNVVAQYPIATLEHAADPEAAAAFVDLVLSPAGQAILERFGFGAP